MPTDGRITSLGTVASLASTDLVMVVAPGNAFSGVNYQANIQQIANYVAGTAAGGTTTEVQFNADGALDGDPALTWVGPNLRVGTVGTVGGLNIVGKTAGGVVFNAVASGAVWTFTLPSTAGTAGFPLVTDGFGTATWTTLLVSGGGVGLTSYSTGDILYASNATTLARLAATTQNFLLASVSATAAPNWIGIVPATVGGVGLTSYSTGDILYASNATTLARLSATTSTSGWPSLISNGTAAAPSWNIVREVLTTSRTYYVRTDGSDSNNGLANNATGAFLTIQHGIDVVSNLDTNSNLVTIQVASGTYTSTLINLKNVSGYGAQGNLVIVGDTSTPTNVVVSGSSGGFDASNLFTPWDIKGFKVITSGGSGFSASGPSQIRLSNIEFGACAVAHLLPQAGGQIQMMTAYNISGNAAYHVLAQLRGFAILNNRTITFSNSPVFTTFVYAGIGPGFIRADSMTFTAGTTVTGQRYYIDSNSVIYTGGQSSTYFPGSVAGTALTGGQYT